MARKDAKVKLLKRGYEDRIGYIESELPFGIYIIRLEDKELVKCLKDDFVVMENEEESTPDPKDKTVTISLKEYSKITGEVIEELTKKDRDPMFTMALSLTGLLVSGEIGKRLFNEDGNNA